MKHSCLFLLAMGLTLPACQEDTPLPPALRGSVQDQAGNVYPNVPLSLTLPGKFLDTQTNEQGQYSFDPVEGGDYELEITPPLATQLQGAASFPVVIKLGESMTHDFVVAPQTLTADLVLGNADVFGEVKNKLGELPTQPGDSLYARNVFDPPLGKLTAIKAPDGHQLTLAEWETAQGTMDVSCQGDHSTLQVKLQGLIPNGTYTFWCDFLNKPKKVGEGIFLGNDLVKIEPLGSATGNVVVADNNGTIDKSFGHSFCVLTETKGLVIVVIYHLNGNTFGAAHIPDEEDVSHLLVYFQ